MAIRRKIARRWREAEIEEFASTPDTDGADALADDLGGVTLATWEAESEDDNASAAPLPPPRKRRRLAILGLLLWARAFNRYRAKSGQFVARRALLSARDRVVEVTRLRLKALSQSFTEGNITLLEWQLGFKDVIRAAHTLAAGMALGGKRNVSKEQWGEIGKGLQIQYEALNRFALQLQQDRPMHLGRVDQYGKAVRMTFLNAERLRIPSATLARWVRTRSESCEGCLGQEARGVQPLASFPPIGSQPCRMNCGCFISYEG